MNRTESNITTRIILITIVLLFVTNLLLSVLLLHNTRITSMTLINERMLDIVNCAAASINGDNLKMLTADSVGTPEFLDVYKSLVAFRDNINKDHLKYIYCVYEDENGDICFALDPDEEAPGQYGEKANHGDGIYDALKGIPTVDTKSYSDSWGNFFSAYSPVYDSDGELVGLVMVDFDANWYKNQIMADMWVIMLVSVISLTVNAAAILLTTNKLRHSLSRLYTEMDILADDISDLTDESQENYDPAVAVIKNGDKISESILRLRTLQKKIRDYIYHMKTQAFSDALTGVGNRTAFAELVDDLNRKIADGTADFAAAVFDINCLKRINDEQGHEAGDSIIVDAATVLKEVYGVQNVYRIGGDEFIVIIQNTTAESIKSTIERVNKYLEDVNRRPERQKATLYLSKGTVLYNSAVDSHFNDVFKRADDEMYADKALFYSHSEDRRRSDRTTGKPKETK